MNANVVSADKPYAFSYHVSWGAILAGVVIALFLEALLNLLGLGLGLITFKIDTDVMTNIGIGTIIWLIISGILSMFIGGWATGRLANHSHKLNGLLHGLAMSGLTIMLSFMLMASAAGSLVSGLANVVTQTVSMAGKGVTGLSKSVSNAAPQIAQMAKDVVPDLNANVSQITQQAEQLLTQANKQVNNTDYNNATTGSVNSAATDSKVQLKQAVTDLLAASNENNAVSARQKLVVFLTQKTNMTAQEAEQTVNNWQQQYNALKVQAAQKAEQAKQIAKQTADKTTTAMGTVSMVAFIVLLLSAIAGGLGAMLGIQSAKKEYEL
jgi:hypothetical protein